jgi:hypothetical protein
MGDLIAAESTRKGAVVEGTNAKLALAWKHYKSYLISIGINNNWYLDNFSREKKIRLLGAFCNAIREGRLHSKSFRTNKLSQLEPPWIMFHRPSSWLEDMTQDSTGTANLLLFYNDNFMDIDPLMHQRSDK